MENDPLAKFRAKPINSSTTKLDTSDGLLEYEAFGTADRPPPHFQIRNTKSPTYSPSYHSLVYIAYNELFGDDMVLNFSSMLVRVTGKNLQPIADAIERHKCTFIRDFNPDFFRPPTDANAPFIEKIELVVKENLSQKQ